ncbi:dihydroorotase [Haematospirillum jordaniae]|uniref:Dihydroorotase n=1 Tax=Haematospirillum jordaniae TaxID=1549855 RepID=A0A143DF74_9PROT|nr:dihydroorotase [Haematospirillum jordaniae]AMW35402.1 dihydroorotase [Haematospirillum jordaniae]NKD45539.1 dihydroorotase [Haematospirillum jordaniae]NKD56165.1 dihydroorotase [Haematospirillum jordaniae]NKD58223.1 dihydroorotase [Haematospirillum jordaniae]NKD66606.1 dihydroorotase [Haematospirillum jordaniae]
MIHNSEFFDLVLSGGTVWMPGGAVLTDIGIQGGRIAAFGSLGTRGERVVDLGGLTVLPGVIDSQVHFREPGLEHKEDLETGTRAAVLGGVTAVFEMPNTQPGTVSAEDLADKLFRAVGRTWCDYAFYIGATAGNLQDLAELERIPGCAGVKVFMGSSTGSLLVADDDTLADVLSQGCRRIAVHCEDEERLKERRGIVNGGADVAMHPAWRDEETALLATTRLLKLARKARRLVHVLHVTTAAEMQLLATCRDFATVEVTPQHLTFAGPGDYERLATRLQMNPPIRDAAHREALWQAVSDGVVDVIGSDHAPHTLEEKARPYPDSPSGMTGVQTLVPVMLTHVASGRLSLARFVDLTSAGPARVFGIAGKGRIALGYDADLTIVDLKQRWTISDSWIASRCGWTPFDGFHATGRPVHTVVRGAFAMRDTMVSGIPTGSPIRFCGVPARSSVPVA